MPTLKEGDKVQFDYSYGGSEGRGYGQIIKKDNQLYVHDTTEKDYEDFSLKNHGNLIWNIKRV